MKHFVCDSGFAFKHAPSATRIVNVGEIFCWQKTALVFNPSPHCSLQDDQPIVCHLMNLQRLFNLAIFKQFQKLTLPDKVLHYNGQLG
jgi:hypothetical protein